jgi:hypothetical protein
MNESFYESQAYKQILLEDDVRYIKKNYATKEYVDSHGGGGVNTDDLATKADLESYPTKEELGTELGDYLTKSIMFDEGDTAKMIMIRPIDKTLSEYDKDNSIIIGGKPPSNATDRHNKSIRIGASSSVSGEGGVAIGAGSSAGSNAVAIGYSVSASDKTIVLGQSSGDNKSISAKFGPNTLSLASDGITFNEQPKLVSTLTPSSTYDITTKKYVDDKVASIVIPEAPTGDYLTEDSIFVSNTNNTTNPDINGNIQIGKDASALVSNALAIGKGAFAGYQHSLAIGNYVKAPYYGIAIGMGNDEEHTVLGDDFYSITIGHRIVNTNNMYNSGKFAIVIGNDCDNTGDWSIVIGNNIINTAMNTTVIGSPGFKTRLGDVEITNTENTITFTVYTTKEVNDEMITTTKSYTMNLS